MEKDLKSKLEVIITDLEALQLARSSPKSYISKFFGDIIKRIDLNGDNILARQKNDKAASSKIISNRTLFLDKILSFEKECLKEVENSINEEKKC